MSLIRFEGNPILEPQPKHDWESKAVFNPAAIYLQGKVHLLYRAMGERGVSVLGYAASSDGLHIDERLDKPMYKPRESFEGILTGAQALPWEGRYASGGGVGGCEDPRLTRIGDQIYMTYVAYDGYNPPRSALTSIAVADFLTRNWRWKRPVLVSPPGIVDKNAFILEELIGGRFVIFHRVFPDILIDFVDDLDFDGRTRWLRGQFKISPRSDYWDSRKIGGGPPPIKTQEGWLLIYHAVDDRDELCYKVGAMLLDLKDPTRVLARSNKPILTPQSQCEREGNKSNIVYPCGAVKIGNSIFVYYGAADGVVCVVTAKLDDLLGELVPQQAALAPKGVPEQSGRKVEAYCFRCRRRRIMNKPRSILLRNARPAIEGECPVCATKMFRTGRLK